MENKSIINKLLILVLVCMVGLSYAQMPPIPGGGAGGGTSGPGTPEETPVDMYEGALMIVAIYIIAGYYFVRNRKQVN